MTPDERRRHEASVFRLFGPQRELEGADLRDASDAYRRELNIATYLEASKADARLEGWLRVHGAAS